MKKELMITGDAGYIGSHLRKLISFEYQLDGIDINIGPERDYNCSQIDIRSLFSWNRNYDTVIHLAALVKVSESEKYPIDYYQTNLFGTLNVLKNVKCKNFIFASTGAAEKCESAYAISKRAAEDCVRSYCQNHGMSYTIFRFYNVIGSDGINPTNPDGLMWNLMRAFDTKKFTIFGNDYNTKDGTCIRDYVHVNEICEAIKTAIEKPSNGLENLGHGVGYSVKEMVHLFEQINNVKIDIEYGPRRKGDLEISVLDNPSKYMKSLYSFKDYLKI
jgi:UDP-glucose 4-epimerase